MPEVLIIQLICFVPSIETCGSEDGQEARVIDTLLGPHNKKSHSRSILSQKMRQINQSDGLRERLSRTGHLLVDCTVAVPTGHRLQHAAEEASVAVRLILCTAGHSVNDSREHLQSDTI